VFHLAQFFLTPERGTAGKRATIPTARLTQEEFRGVAPLVYKRLTRSTMSTRTLGRLRRQVKVMRRIGSTANRFATVAKPDIAIGSGGALWARRCHCNPTLSLPSQILISFSLGGANRIQGADYPEGLLSERSASDFQPRGDATRAGCIRALDLKIPSRVTERFDSNERTLQGGHSSQRNEIRRDG